MISALMCSQLEVTVKLFEMDCYIPLQEVSVSDKLDVNHLYCQGALRPSFFPRSKGNQKLD